MTHPCSDHSYGLVLRRKLLFLLHLLGLLRFMAAVLLDRLGIVPCHDEMLPGQPWCEYVDTAAMERLMEAAFWAPSSPPINKRSFKAPRYRRRRQAASAEDKGAEEDDEGAAICTICLAGLEVGGYQVTELCNCSHAFHAACIDGWIGSGEADTCPLCRTPMLPIAWDGQPEAVPCASR